jgi:transglutaminase-like putative cysteine protease
MDFAARLRGSLAFVSALAPTAQQERADVDRAASAIAAMRLDVKQISSGSNGPPLDLSQDRRAAFLVMVRHGVPTAAAACALGWSDADAGSRLAELVQAEFLRPAGGGYKACVAVMTDADVSRFMAVDAAKVEEVAGVFASRVPALRTTCERIPGLRHASFEDASLFLLSDVLLDNWQIGAVEREVLGRERPIRAGGRYYLAVQERTGETEAFGIYGNQIADVGEVAIGVYGNRRGVDDVLALSARQLRERLGGRGADSLADLRLELGRSIVAAAAGNGEVAREARAGLESLGLARSGRVCVPVLGPEDEAALRAMAEDAAPPLIQALREHRPRLEQAYRASPYATEISFEEYFIWWYHLFYSAVTERLAAMGHVALPSHGTTTYVMHRQAATARAAARAPRLEFSELPDSTVFEFRRSHPDDPYLKELRERFGLQDVIAGEEDDYGRMRAVCAWVRGRWEHNGMNEPKKSDPISILEAAAQGRRFRCVEYAIVLDGALNALGIPSRVLALKTRDVETRQSGAGHVVVEAYLADLEKWILIDGQFDVIPTLDGEPLNAVELQRALAEVSESLDVDSLGGTRAGVYFPWIAPYLHYFDVSIDGRHGVERTPGSLMLVPIGARKPKTFQIRWPITNMSYTHSLATFYAPPELVR